MTTKPKTVSKHMPAAPRSLLHKLKIPILSLKRFKPLILIQLYLIITYLFYIFGPFNYQQLHAFPVFLLIIIYQIALALGYIWVSRNHQLLRTDDKIVIPRIPNGRILSWCLFVGAFLTLIQTVAIINASSIGDILPSIAHSISNPGDAYVDSLKSSDKVNGSLNSYLLIFLGPVFYLAFTWSVFWFRRIPQLARFATILYSSSLILQSLVSGQNIGLFKTLFVIVIVVVTSKLTLTNSVFPVKKHSNKTFYFLVLAFVLTVFVYFAATMHGRSSNSQKITSFSNVSVNENHWLLKFSPEIVHKPIIMGAVYTSSGYKGLDYALSQPFDSTYGLGNGYFTLGIAEKIGFEGAYSRTYVAKISDKWHPTINWHTAYVWFANDVSFYGVPILLFLIGAIFSYTIYTARRFNLFAISLLPMVAIMVFFLPSNNYILGNPGTNIIFSSVLLLLLLSNSTRFKKNKFIIAIEKKLFL